MYEMIEKYRNTLLLMKYYMISLEEINKLPEHDYNALVIEIKQRLKTK